MPAKDELYMCRCLELAALGIQHAKPNPMVGAVLVHEDHIIGEGYHARYGEAHAEVACFNAVKAEHKSLIPQSTLYVSLEPCAHYGKTPPCALRIIEEGVKKVVICNDDPFPKVAGRGTEMLRNAGIEIQSGLLADEGAWLNRRFFTLHRLQRPYIVLKWAQSLDGFIAPADSSRRQLSNHFSQTLVHKWRTEEAAIMVGYNTALHDNPRLTARHWEGPQPLRIALDRRAMLPRAHHLFDNSTATWILTEAPCADIPYYSASYDESLLPQLMQRLYDNNTQSLLVEGGSALLKSFIEAGLWDEARIFTAPVTLGSGIAAPWLINSRFAGGFDMHGDQLHLFLNHTCPNNFPADSAV